MVIGILPLIILTVTLFSSIESYYKKEMKEKIYRQANTVAVHMSVTGGMNSFSPYSSSYTYLESIKSAIDGTVMLINPSGRVVYDSKQLEVNRTYGTREVMQALDGEAGDIYLEDGSIIKVLAPVKDANSGEVMGVVLMTGSFDGIRAAIDGFKTISYLSITALTLVILVFNYYFSNKIMNPFKRFIQTINRVTAGHLNEPFEIKGNYEIEEIGTAFNHMIERLGQVDGNRQQFVANVSHELKTPLTSMKVLAETLLNEKDAPKELYREFLEDISNEVDRETKIINDLLVLVTLDKQADSLNIETVDINKLIEHVMRRVKPLADLRDIAMELKSYRKVEAEVDETKLSLVFTNLLENGIKYNVDGGKLTVSLNADHREFTMWFSDTGIGIPKESREQIFRRFYRVDKTRSRDTGGTGLGLSIVHSTVMMHGGSIVCESNTGPGTTFILRMPLKHAGGNG